MKIKIRGKKQKELNSKIKKKKKKSVHYTIIY